jgi:hypothetical protein
MGRCCFLATSGRRRHVVDRLILSLFRGDDSDSGHGGSHLGFGRGRDGIGLGTVRKGWVGEVGFVGAYIRGPIAAVRLRSNGRPAI